MEDIGELVGGIKRPRDEEMSAEIEQQILPKLINVTDFAKRHKKEVQQLQMALSTHFMVAHPTEEPRIARPAAPDLRRRTNSHQRRSIPAKRRMTTVAKKTPEGNARYRATRRKNSQLEKEWHLAREAWSAAVMRGAQNSADISTQDSSSSLRLPLHRWHTKRMVMENNFGVLEPSLCQGRGVKAAIEDSRADATISDCSSTVTVQLTGLLTHLIKVLDCCAGDSKAASCNHDSNEAAAEALSAPYCAPGLVMGRVEGSLQLKTRPPGSQGLPSGTSTSASDARVYHGPVCVLWSGVFAPPLSPSASSRISGSVTDALCERAVSVDPETTAPQDWLKCVSCVQLQCSAGQASALSRAVEAACGDVCPPSSASATPLPDCQTKQHPWDTSIESALAGQYVHGSVQLAQHAVFHLRGAMALPILRGVLLYPESEFSQQCPLQSAPWAADDLRAYSNMLIRGQWAMKACESIHTSTVHEREGGEGQAAAAVPRAVIAVDTTAGAAKVTVDASAVLSLAQPPHSARVHSARAALLPAVAAAQVAAGAIGKDAQPTANGNIRVVARRQRHAAARRKSKAAAARFDSVGGAAAAELLPVPAAHCKGLLRLAGGADVDSSAPLAACSSMSVQLVEPTAKGGAGRGVVVRAPQAVGAQLWQALVFAGAKPIGCSEAGHCCTIEGRPSFPRDYVDTPAGHSWWEQRQRAGQKSKACIEARGVLEGFAQLLSGKQSAQGAAEQSAGPVKGCYRVCVKLLGTASRPIQAGARLYAPHADELHLWKEANRVSGLRELRIEHQPHHAACGVVTDSQYSWAAAARTSTAVVARSAMQELKTGVKSGALAGRCRRRAWPILLGLSNVPSSHLLAGWVFGGSLHVDA